MSSKFKTPPPRPSHQSSPAPSSANNSHMSTTISYEKFAPRSSVQLSRLAQIGNLTLGPIQETNASTPSKFASPSSSKFATPTRQQQQQQQQQLEERKDFLLRSMLEDSSGGTANNGKVERGRFDTTEDTLRTLSWFKEYHNHNNDHDNRDLNYEVDAIIDQTLQGVMDKSKYYNEIYKKTTSLRMALRASLNISEDISNKHLELIRHSSELSIAADKLQEEERILTKHAEEIGLPLKHYDTIDTLGVVVGVLFKATGNTKSRNRRDPNISSSVATVRGIAKVKVDDDEYRVVLDQIDDAAAFFAAECDKMQRLQPQQPKKQDELMSGSIEYYRRSLILQEAALDLIREAVVERIQNTTQHILSALSNMSSSSTSSSNDKKQSQKNAINADKLEASLIYTRFYGISQRSNRLINIIYDKLGYNMNSNSKPTNNQGLVLGNKELAYYHDLLHTCRSTYCSSREMLLKNTIELHLNKLNSIHGLIGMTRLASVFLIRLCTIETSLYTDFFGKRTLKQQQQEEAKAASTAENSNDETTINANDANNNNNALKNDIKCVPDNNAEFQNYLLNLCKLMYKTIRRGIISTSDIDILCQIIIISREERSLTSHSTTTIPVAHVLSTIIQDTQERLIFITNSTLNKQLHHYKATTADLDYPNKIIQLKNTVGTADATNDSKATEEENAEKQLQSVYASWYPPVRSVLQILSKLFRVVDTNVFEDIALQSVQACTKSLKDASYSILSTNNSKKEKIGNNEFIKIGEIHSDLFLIKHLLILREQLSPFDMNLRSIERQLDFSDAGRAIGRFIASRRSNKTKQQQGGGAAAGSNDGSMVGGGNLDGTNSGNVSGGSIFSLNTNENALFILLREGVHVQESSIDSKRDLEDALRTTCNHFIDHSYGLIMDQNNFIKLLDDMQELEEGEKDYTTKLNESISTTYVTNVTVENFLERFYYVTNQMALYLDNPATQSILLKPISKKIIRSFEVIKKFMFANSNESQDNTTFTLLETMEQKVKSFKPKSSTISSIPLPTVEPVAAT